MKKLPIKLELRKLGLSGKEVSVYLAGLELGPTSVKSISEKAEVKRPTTYEIIDRLKEKGLFYTIKEDGKKYFVAQSPHKILGILRIQKREIEEKEREFIRILAALEAEYSSERGGIKIYKGEKERKVLLEEVFAVTPVYNIFAISSQTESTKIKERDKIYKGIKKRLGKLKAKELFQKESDHSRPEGVQVKTASALKLKGTLLLFDKAAFFPEGKEEALLIENELTVSLLKSLFLTLWKLN
ncbi:MAG: hypothetical protein GF370_03065 [Candidatus Nealsonbacteria bacterium]|nr:hypothetical protein [Candidatus Nealsonbacteria bacterium]